MPEIEINGEKKKVACGPCIRGHRSSKCTHKDRVLIEVRKPGRPLSACPHPTGSCSCERMVVNYTLPKTSQCSCSPTSGPSSGPTSGRVQKGKAKKPASSLNTHVLQRAFSTDGETAHELTNGSATAPAVPTKPKKSCCGGSGDPDVVEEDTSTSQNSNNPPVTQPTGQSNHSTDETPRLRLGMFGIGGYRASDHIGWNKPYPDMYNVSYEQNGVSRHLTTPINSSTKAPAQDETVTAGSCCAPQPADLASNSSSSPDRPKTALSTHNHHPSVSETTHNIFASSLNGHAGQQIPGRPPVPQQRNGYQPAMQGSSLQAPISGSMPSTQMAVASPPDDEHTCSCGEGCACLACLTHPYNKTTLDYVRYHTDLSMRFDETAFHPNMQSHVPHSSADNTTSLQQAVNSTTQSSHDETFTPWLVNPSGNMNGSVSQKSWPSPGHPQATPTQELEHLNLRPHNTDRDFVRGATNGNPDAASLKQTSSELPSTPAYAFNGLEGTSAFDGNSPHQSEDTPTMSPSSFFLQSYTMPGCDDATGTCQCGDGCTCDGCLTHTGHQQVQPQPQNIPSYTSHGPGCACPHPERTQPSNLNHASVHNPPIQHVSTPYAPGTHITNGPAFTTPQPMNGVVASTFTHIHGPNCACPVDTAVLQAQAQVQAHAQLHGPHCRCPTGMVFLNAQLQAEARLHNQIHGDQASPWVGGTPG